MKSLRIGCQLYLYTIRAANLNPQVVPSRGQPLNNFEYPFFAQPGGTFSFVDYFMYQYPKQSLTIEQQMQPIFDKILSLSKEILISEQARDRLLSKLMSGELEVLE